MADATTDDTHAAAAGDAQRETSGNPGSMLDRDAPEPVSTRPESVAGTSGTSRSRRRRALVALLVVLLVTAPGAGWIAVRAQSARDHLSTAADLVLRLRHQLDTGDPGAVGTLHQLQEHTRAARRDTGDFGWRLAAHAPVVGADLAAASSSVEILDDLVHDGLPALVEAVEGLAGAKRATAGRVPLGPVLAAARRVAAADLAVRHARERVGAIAVERLLSARVRAGVIALRAALDRVAVMTRAAGRGLSLLPPMLGAGGRRTYLVLFQNLAEIRATGGMPGAYVVVSAVRGRIGILDQGTATADLRVFTRPVLPLDRWRRALYTDRIGRYPANINLTPHFPTVAALAREMYRRRTGRSVDGVLATDPVALSYVLRMLGPVPVPGGPTLTAGNAVRVLLSETYAREPLPENQDKYYAAAARAVFEAVTMRPIRLPALLAQLGRAGTEHRLLIWSARPKEQRLIAGTALGGVLPTDDGARPTVGVFLNDGSGSKLGYYLTQAAELAVVGGCRPDGRRDLRLRVTLGSTAPTAGLSRHVLGLGLAGDPYTLRVNVSIFGPSGGALGTVRLDGEPHLFGSGVEEQRAVGVVTVDLKPGGTRTLEATLLTGVPATDQSERVTPRLWMTPAVTPWRYSERSADGCVRIR